MGELFGRVVMEKSWMDPVIILEAFLVCDMLGLGRFVSALYLLTYYFFPFPFS
jgi:hypothetical protein